MKNKYLFDTDFAIYRSGLYDGIVRFTEKNIQFGKVDRRTRVQLYFDEYKSNNNGPDPNGPNPDLFIKIYKNINLYNETKWYGDKVILENGDVFNRHITFTGEVNGKEVVSQLWAERSSQDVMDIITVDNKIVAFIRPGRTTMEILVVKGYENVTPLTKYNDTLLSKIEYGINFLGNFMVPMRDGIKLATEVYLPDGIKSKIPSILVRTCYGKKDVINDFEHFVSRGYAVIIQDIRGRDDSEGDFLPYYHERDDGSDTIDWITSQKWSDGNVGMWGASYLGFIVMAAATSGNPNLKAIVNEVNVGSPFVDTIRPGGTVGSWLTLMWSLAQSIDKRIDFSVFSGQSVNPLDAINLRPLEEIPEKTIGKKSYHWDIWAKHYKYDDFWKHGDLTEHGHKIKSAMLVQSGWHDGDIKGVAETWEILTKYDVPNRRIVLGPWPHSLNTIRDMMDFHYGNNAIDYDFDTRILRWFDRFLKGIDNGEDKQPRATYYLDNENKWMTSEEWNPKETTITNFYLYSNGNANSCLGDGKIVFEPKTESMEDTYLCDPNNACGSIELIEQEPIICNEFEMRSDVLVYTSDELTEDLAVVGEICAEFYASSSAVDTDWCVRITDVDENGISRKIGDSIIRAEYRKGRNNLELLTPGKIEKYNLSITFCGHVFKKGHKLRVEITSTYQYFSFPNTNTGINPFEEPKPVIAIQKIYHNKKYPSHIKLPVLNEKF